ncbi:hypothetical protein ABK040_012874 [Willaertia magna]
MNNKPFYPHLNKQPAVPTPPILSTFDNFICRFIEGSLRAFFELLKEGSGNPAIAFLGNYLRIIAPMQATSFYVYIRKRLGMPIPTQKPQNQ